MTTATKRIPIAEAYFCEDCDCVVDSAVQCECGSAALMSLSGVLNRPEQKPQMVMIPISGRLGRFIR